MNINISATSEWFPWNVLCFTTLLRTLARKSMCLCTLPFCTPREEKCPWVFLSIFSFSKLYLPLKIIMSGINNVTIAKHNYHDMMIDLRDEMLYNAVTLYSTLKTLYATSILSHCLHAYFQAQLCIPRRLTLIAF